MAGNRKQGFLRGNQGGASAKEKLKSYIKCAERPFDGSGSAFKAALTELRKEGFNIVYVAEKCHYVKL